MLSFGDNKREDSYVQKTKHWKGIGPKRGKPNAEAAAFSKPHLCACI